MAHAANSRTSRACVPLLRVRDLVTSFAPTAGDPRVDGVVLSEVSGGAGQTVGVVGESGCGKSVTALSSCGSFLRRRGTSNRDIELSWQNLLALRERDMRELRGTRSPWSFQEP